MDELEEKNKDLVRLARLALTGRAQDVQTYVTRMSRKYQKLAPELAIQLKDLLKAAPTRRSPLRNEAMAAIPLDRDSHLHLLRFESDGLLEHEPIWQRHIDETLRQLVLEHQQVDALQSRGLAPTRTAIFTGPPGVGKTLAARWIARELERPLLTLDSALRSIASSTAAWSSGSQLLPWLVPRLRSGRVPSKSRGTCAAIE